MKGKYIIVLILCAAALAGYLLLPFVSIQFFGSSYDISILDIISETGISLDGEGSIFVIATIVGGILGIVGGISGSKVLSVLGSVIGFAGILIFLLMLKEEMGSASGMMEDFMGSAAWVGMAGFAAATIVAGVVKD